MTSSSRSRLLATALAAALATAASCPSAQAQERTAADLAQARELLNEGLALRDHGDAAGALEKLRGAHALVHTPITAYEVGQAYAQLGRLVEAREAFLSIARMPPTSQETARSATARAEGARLANQLRSRIPSLRVRVTGASAATVTVDGAEVPAEALAAPRLVDPGAHDVLARSPGGEARAHVEVKEGEERDVELRIVPAAQGPVPVAPAPASGGPAPVTSPEAPPPAPAPSHTLAWTLVLGGAAVGIAGGALMFVATGQASQAGDRRDHPAYDGAVTLWTASLVGALVGAGAVVGGGILFLATPTRKEARVQPAGYWIGAGPGEVRLGGAW